MHINKAAVVAAVAALSEQAQASNAHRHMHHHVGKRAVETDWVVKWETVYVTAGQEAPKPTADAAAAPAAPAVPDSKPVDAADVAPHDVSPTTMVTSAKAVPTNDRQLLGLNGNQVGVPVDASVGLGNGAGPDTVSVPQPTTQAAPAPEPTTQAAPAPQSKTVEPAPAAPASSHSSSSSSSGAPCGSKRGIAYNSASQANYLASQLGNTWAYNWGTNPDGLDSSVTFVPMLWGPGSEHSSGWSDAMKKAIDDKVPVAFSLNEPDLTSQDNQSPADAAASYQQFMNPYAGQIGLCAPAISSTVAPNMGLDWLEQYMQACDGKCHHDYMCAHWYGPAQINGKSSVDDMMEFVQQVSEKGGNLPVFLTEFAVQDGDEEAWLEEAMQQLDSADSVAGYSYFMAGQGYLFNSNSESDLSGIGMKYAVPSS